jgi:Nitroreductase family
MRTDLVAIMVGAARYAPSIHNSQPWRFDWTGEALEVLADDSRATPAVDPVGRWLHLACGAAAFNADVAARAAGRLCAVSVLPDRSRPDLMALVGVVGERPPTPEDVGLEHAIAERHTVRTAFDDTVVPAALVDRLRAAAEHEGCWMHVVSRPEDIVELAVLTERAEAAESADESYQAELRAWTRAPGEEAQDGIPLNRIPAKEQLRPTDVPIRDFHGRGPGHRPGEAGVTEPDPPHVERPLLVIVGTDGDHRADWVRSGMAMQRLWLTATAAGLGASPITQAMDHAGPRALLKRLVGQQNHHPQILLRLGYCRPDRVTGRRPVADLLVRR